MHGDNAVDTYMRDFDRRIRDGFNLVGDDLSETDSQEEWVWLDVREPVDDFKQLPWHWDFEVPA